MPTEDALYLGLCVVALVVAAHAPEDQRNGAFLAALLLLANWLLCGWTYQANAPQIWLRSKGLPVAAVDIWVCADVAMGGLSLLLAKVRWWGWILWSIAVAQVSFHYFNEALTDAAYLFWLDKLLLAQIACFILIGGNGVVQRVGRGWASVPFLRGVGRHAFHKKAKS